MRVPDLEHAIRDFLDQRQQPSFGAPKHIEVNNHNYLVFEQEDLNNDFRTLKKDPQIGLVRYIIPLSKKVVNSKSEVQLDFYPSLVQIVLGLNKPDSQLFIHHVPRNGEHVLDAKISYITDSSLEHLEYYLQNPDVVFTQEHLRLGHPDYQQELRDKREIIRLPSPVARTVGPTILFQMFLRNEVAPKFSRNIKPPAGFNSNLLKKFNKFREQEFTDAELKCSCRWYTSIKEYSPKYFIGHELRTYKEALLKELELPINIAREILGIPKPDVVVKLKTPRVVGGASPYLDKLNLICKHCGLDNMHYFLIGNEIKDLALYEAIYSADIDIYQTTTFTAALLCKSISGTSEILKYLSSGPRPLLTQRRFDFTGVDPYIHDAFQYKLKPSAVSKLQAIEQVWANDYLNELLEEMGIDDEQLHEELQLNNLFKQFFKERRTALERLVRKHSSEPFCLDGKIEHLYGKIQFRHFPTRLLKEAFNISYTNFWGRGYDARAYIKV